MGSLKGVEITKGGVGPSASGPDTAPSALISNGVAVATKLVLNTVYKITSLKQAEDELGITSNYDTTNDVVLHQHIVDFYSDGRNAGVDLYIMVTDAPTPAAALEDTGAIYAKKLITAGKGAIWQLGLAWSYATGFTETLTDGISSEIRSAVPKAQLLADWAYENNKPVHIVLEGRKASTTLSTLIDLRDIDVSGTVLMAPQVSVVIGQDWDYAEGRKTASANSKTVNYAAVGKCLGTIAAAEMNQSIAEVASFNISNAKKGTFVTVGLSNHKKIEEVESDLEDLDEKGYIFPISFNTQAISGYRWNNDHNCVPVVVDDNGFYNDHTIYFSRTLNVCAMKLRDVLLLRVKQRVSVDPSTGKLSKAVIKNLEADADTKVFVNLANRGLIQAGKTFLDADSDLINAPKTLLASFQVQATPILDNIAGSVNLVKSIQL